MILLDGKKVRDEIAKTLRGKIAAFSFPPKLAIIQMGEREESRAYIREKKLFGESIGVEVVHIRLPESASELDILLGVQEFNADKSVHGIILQLPIPAQLNKQKLIDAIAPEKDVDGLTSANVAARQAGDADATVPATARGIIELLGFYQIPIRGKKAAVLGRSALVGAPTAEVLRHAGALVTVCHSQTPNTREITRESDIIIVAIGKPRLIGREFFRDDRTQVVVDVGITAVTEKGEARLEEEIPKKKLVGDVDFEAVKDMVAAISPVPGGVGPMTVACLFENVVDCML